MSAIKARKQGNSIMVTIPSALGVKEGEEFYVIKKDNGAITLIPKVEDYLQKQKMKNITCRKKTLVILLLREN